MVAHTVMTSTHLSMSAKCVYSLLTTYINRDSGSWRVSKGKLARDLGCSESTIKRALHELDQAGVIKRTRHRRDGHEGVATTTLLDFITIYQDPADHE